MADHKDEMVYGNQWTVASELPDITKAPEDADVLLYETRAGHVHTHTLSSLTRLPPNAVIRKYCWLTLEDPNDGDDGWLNLVYEGEPDFDNIPDGATHVVFVTDNGYSYVRGIDKVHDLTGTVNRHMYINMDGPPKPKKPTPEQSIKDAIRDGIKSMANRPESYEHIVDSVTKTILDSLQNQNETA